MTPTSFVLSIYQDLAARDQTLAFAESCTGGQICAVMSSQPGISQVLRGGVVAYSEEMKHVLLQVPLALIAQFGVVSDPVARAMAQGVKKIMKADWALSTTGYAGPTGGDVHNPVGTVHFFLIGPHFESGARRVFSGDRLSIQKQASDWALDWVMKTVTGQI